MPGASFASTIQSEFFLIRPHTVAYRGCNHEGYEGGGHDVPVGTEWTDVWGTRWEGSYPDSRSVTRGIA